MRGGVLQQLGQPRDLYDRPANLFVATFIGAPPMNLLPGVLHRVSGRVRPRLAGARIALPPVLFGRKLGLWLSGTAKSSLACGPRPPGC